MNEFDEFFASIPAVFHYTAPTCNSKDEWGTAVLVQAETRIFAVTARHCIDSAGMVFTGYFVTLVPNTRPLSALVLRKALHPRLDIGFFELDPSFRSAPHAQAGPCALEQLLTGAVPVGGAVQIIGYPRYGDARRHRDIELTLTGVQTAYLRSENERHYFDYPTDSFIVKQGSPVKTPVATEDPYGFSGGGCWAFVRSRPDELFNPLKHIRLIGIQSGWLEERRQLVAVPIVHFLALLRREYPDLRATIDALFPDAARATI